MGGESVSIVDEAPQPPPSPEETFRRIAQNAGIAVALLYAGGALDLVADLRGNGVSVVDVFPIIPIEQHMARSVELLVSPRGLALGALLVATLLVFEALARRRRGEAGGGGLVGWVRRQPLPAVVALLAVYIALFFFRPLVVAQQTISLAAIYMLTRWRGGRPVAVSTRMVVIICALLVGFVARSYLLPRPLPRAEVQVEGGAAVSGLFVAVVGNSWYLAQPNGVMAVVGEKHVITARVVPRPDSRGWKEATLPGLLGGG